MKKNSKFLVLGAPGFHNFNVDDKVYFWEGGVVLLGHKEKEELVKIDY